MSDTLLEHPYSYLRSIPLVSYLPEASSFYAIHTYIVTEADVGVTRLRATVNPLLTDTSACPILYGALSLGSRCWAKRQLTSYVDYLRCRTKMGIRRPRMRERAQLLRHGLRVVLLYA